MTGSCSRLLAERFSVSQGMPVLPPAREFLTSAGFGGAGVLLSAIIGAALIVFAVRNSAKRHKLLLEQQERHHDQVRQDEQRATRIQECRERLAWVVDKGGIEPAASEGATVGFGPELALTVLQGIHDDAEELADPTLARAAAVQLTQLSRVLAKQNGAASPFGAVDSAATDPPPAVQSESHAASDPPTIEGKDPSPPARQVPAAGGHRRQ